MIAKISLSRAQATAFRAGSLMQHRAPITPQPTGVGSQSDDLFGDQISAMDHYSIGKGQSWVDLISQCPFGKVGEMIEVQERLPYGKSQSLGFVTLVAVNVAKLELITDAEVIQEGHANWTQYAYAWNEHHARAGMPWDIDPYVWVLSINSLQPEKPKPNY